MRILLSSLAVIAALLGGCTKRNENLCCIDEADCNQIGESSVVPCNDGFVCRGNQCIAIACTTNSDCDATAPFCDTATGRCEEACAMDNQCPGFEGDISLGVCEASTCVECRDNDQCGSGLPACVSNACVECSEDSQCDGPVGACVDNQCIECREDAQCSDPTPACISNQCLECRDNSQCDGNRPICDGNACRACTANSECASGACTDDGSCVASAEIVYAAPLGSTSSNCSQTEPCTFARALMLLGSRQTMVLSDGTFMTPCDHTLNGVVRVVGNASASSRIVSTGTRVNAVLRIGRGADVVLEDVTLTGGKDNTSPVGGAGMSCVDGLNRVRMRRVTLEENEGPGVFGLDCQLSLSDSRILSNGGHAFDVRGTVGSIVSVERSVLAENFSGGNLTRGDFIVRNSFIMRNVTGVTLRPTLGSVFEFNTVVDNGTGLACDQNTDDPAVMLTARNNVFARTGPNTLGAQCNATSSYVTPGIAGLNFVSPDSRPFDYHIAVGSSAVDQATAGEEVLVDVDGEPRPAGAARDLGADELQ
jgi:hypothetical protein